MSLERRAMMPAVAKRWISYALLLAFAVRALVPAGFMPDLAAAADGTFKIVICSASGFKTVALDPATGAPVHPAGDHADEPCTFSGLATLSLPDLAIADLGVLSLADAPVQPHREAVLPPVRAGPVLGSRGPPTLT